MTTKSKSTRHSRSGRHVSHPTRYRAPTYSPHHHLSQLRMSTLPSLLTHDINTDSIHHCDSESLLSLSDSHLTSSSHSDRHLEPKCVVCHLSSRRKSGLSCIKCHDYRIFRTIRRTGLLEWRQWMAYFWIFSIYKTHRTMRRTHYKALSQQNSQIP